MSILKFCAVPAAFFLAACAGAVALKAVPGTAYYCGAAASFTPDGRLPYNDTEAALKREVLDGGALIIETMTLPGVSPGMPPEERVLELKRRKRTLIYEVSGSGGASGTVTFAGPALGSWSYDIKLAGGGGIKGSGSLSGEGLKTQKILSGVKRPMLVREDLKPVSGTVYSVRVGAMKPSWGAE